MSADEGNAQPERSEFDEIPVNELIRLTREFTRRITNQDRQRLGLDLRESGHSRSLQITAPVTLQQFFSGEIDLDSDLARRFLSAPLLAYFRLVAESGESSPRQATAIISSNDDAAILTVDAYTIRVQEAALEFTFTLHSALALRFRLPSLGATDRRRWLDLMRRANGIAFLWTRERWEQPYLIFVVREYFARLYAFSPHGFEAAARLTPDMVTALVDWLEDLWFPDRYPQHDDAEIAAPTPPVIDERSAWSERSSRAEKARRAAVPDAPEEQWEEEPAPPEVYDTQPEPLDHPEVGESDLSADDLDW
jgi:hypothetical protein